MRSFFTSRKQLPGLTAIGLDPDGVSVVRIVRHDGAPPSVTACDFIACNADDYPQALIQLTHNQRLERSRCTTVLEQGGYKLLMTEAPPVAEQDLRAALRWRIKDLTDLSPADVIMDVFDAPGGNVAGRSRPVYLVAAHKDAVRERIRLLSAARVNLQIIEIAELAQRNIAALLPEERTGVAMLWLHDDGGLLTLTRQNELYLTRNLGFGTQALADPMQRAQVFDQLVLEVQRSLDYFESHFRQPPLRHLMLAPVREPVDGLLDYLRGNLGVQCANIDMEPLLTLESDLPPGWQARHFLTLGAALRQETPTA